MHQQHYESNKTAWPQCIDLVHETAARKVISFTVTHQTTVELLQMLHSLHAVAVSLSVISNKNAPLRHGQAAVCRHLCALSAQQNAEVLLGHCSLHLQLHCTPAAAS
jgi:hypothetical protein